MTLLVYVPEKSILGALEMLGNLPNAVHRAGYPSYTGPVILHISIRRT